MPFSSHPPGALGSGDASAVVEVSVPHTTGLSAVGNAKSTSSCSVGNRTAR
ncbi:hypothetical protein [Streptomyces sp. NPDC005209]|uniref:hypothetical protein n=1 Tax=Streptomyces sp. NPDC005209 TaxID=3156715 RepID=UPI0033AF44A9